MTLEEQEDLIARYAFYLHETKPKKMDDELNDVFELFEVMTIFEILDE